MSIVNSQCGFLRPKQACLFSACKYSYMVALKFCFLNRFGVITVHHFLKWIDEKKIKNSCLSKIYLNLDYYLSVEKMWAIFKSKLFFRFYLTNLNLHRTIMQIFDNKFWKDRKIRMLIQKLFDPIVAWLVTSVYLTLLTH